MSGLLILKYFRPILDKKDPPEDKELAILNPSGPLSNLTLLPTSVVAKVTKIETICYQKWLSNSSTET